MSTVSLKHEHEHITVIHKSSKRPSQIVKVHIPAQNKKSKPPAPTRLREQEHPENSTDQPYRPSTSRMPSGRAQRRVALVRATTSTVRTCSSGDDRCDGSARCRPSSGRTSRRRRGCRPARGVRADVVDLEPRVVVCRAARTRDTTRTRAA